MHQSLQEIHLVDVTDLMLNLMSAAFLQRISSSTTSSGDVIELGKDTVETTIQRRKCVLPKGFLIHDQVQLFIHPCDITKLKVDAIVCSADKTLSCSTGLAKFIADIAGKDFKDTCHKYSKAHKLGPSDVVPMPAHNLPVVFHAVAPRLGGSWRYVSQNDVGTFKELLSTTFYNVLAKGTHSNLQTLAIPPIGAGKFLEQYFMKTFIVVKPSY
jgi:O-acetyl-ADP-ribose deacetylase (regulator of RNase III)